MTLVIRENFFPEILWATEEKDEVIELTHAFSNGHQLFLEHLQHFREATRDNDYVIVEVDLIFTSSTGFVREVVGINE